MHNISSCEAAKPLGRNFKEERGRVAHRIGCWRCQARERKSREEIDWRSQRGRDVSWCKRRGYGGEGFKEADDWLWPLQKVERGKTKDLSSKSKSLSRLRGTLKKRKFHLKSCPYSTSGRKTLHKSCQEMSLKATHYNLSEKVGC